MDGLKCLLIAGASLSALCSARTMADAADVISDARCMLVGMQMGDNTDASVRTAGLMAVYYYLGRLDGASPKPDLETLLAREAASMTPTEMQAEATRCGSDLSARGKQLRLIGQHLVERGKQQQLEEQQKKQ